MRIRLGEENEETEKLPDKTVFIEFGLFAGDCKGV